MIQVLGDESEPTSKNNPVQDCFLKKSCAYSALTSLIYADRLTGDH